MIPTPIRGNSRTTAAKASAPTSLHRNAAEPWLHKYLTTLSDWQTYLTPDGGGLEERAATVTGAFFAPNVLKGAAWVLGTHLCQQATASAASILARDWLRGEELGTHGGIVVRKLQLAKRTPRKQIPQDEALGRELETLVCFSGLGERAQTVRDGLSRKVQLQDRFTFTESGRAWLCYTLRFSSHTGEPNRLLSVLSLVSFPNRSYYFDRLLPFNLAVEITRGRTAPDTVPGFIGNTVELDLLLPLVRLAKLGLYALNWYLIDPAERDAGPALDEPIGYDGLIPPGGSGSSGSPGRPYTTRPRSGRRTGTQYPSGFGNWGSVAPPPPDYFGAPPPPGTAVTGAPVQASFLPTGSNSASTNLGPAPVNVAINLENKTGGQDTVWVTVEEDAYQVLDVFNRPTGLSVAPTVTLDDKGNFITHANRWHVVHTETGKLLNTNALGTLHQVRQLADRLTTVVDWTRPFAQFTAQDREQAQNVLSRLS